MSYNFNNQTTLQKPATDSKYIPAGKFIDIDEKYYTPTKTVLNHQPEVFGNMGKPIKPYGENVNYQVTPFIEQEGSLSMLKVNYGSYIYNQITGWDSAHPN